jgi:hypothetical protein
MFTKRNLAALGLLTAVAIVRPTIAHGQMLTTYTFDFGSASAPLDAGTAQSPSSDFNGSAGLSFVLPLFDSTLGQSLESVTGTLTATVQGTILAYNFNATPVSFQNAFSQVELGLNVPPNTSVTFTPAAFDAQGVAQPFFPPTGNYTASSFAVAATTMSNPLVFSDTNAFVAPGGGSLILTLVSDGGSVGGPSIANLAWGTNADVTVYGSVQITYTSFATAIPEPRGSALGLGVSALVGVVLLHGRRRGWRAAGGLARG